MTDRLALIKARHAEAGWGNGDLAWLVAEVERLQAESGNLQTTIAETRLERDGLRNRLETLERRARETALPFRSVLNWWMCSDPWPASEEDHFALECWLNAECEWRNYRIWVEAYHEEPDEALNSGRGVYQP